MSAGSCSRSRRVVDGLDVLDQRGQRHLVPAPLIGTSGFSSAIEARMAPRIELPLAADLVERPPPAAAEIETMAAEDAGGRGVGDGQFGEGQWKDSLATPARE